MRHKANAVWGKKWVVVGWWDLVVALFYTVCLAEVSLSLSHCIFLFLDYFLHASVCLCVLMV